MHARVSVVVLSNLFRPSPQMKYYRLFACYRENQFAARRAASILQLALDEINDGGARLGLSVDPRPTLNATWQRWKLRLPYMEQT